MKKHQTLPLFLFLTFFSFNNCCAVNNYPLANYQLDKIKKAIAKEYEQTKRACNACHVAERVPFINVIDPVYRWQPIQ
jgi:hypothetical protein